MTAVHPFIRAAYVAVAVVGAVIGIRPAFAGNTNVPGSDGSASDTIKLGVFGDDVQESNIYIVRPSRSFTTDECNEVSAIEKQIINHLGKETLTVELRQSFQEFLGPHFTCDGNADINTPTTKDAATFGVIREVLLGNNTDGDDKLLAKLGGKSTISLYDHGVRLKYGFTIAQCADITADAMSIVYRPREKLSHEFRQSLRDFLAPQLTCDGPTEIITSTTADVAAFDSLSSLLLVGTGDDKINLADHNVIRKSGFTTEECNSIYSVGRAVVKTLGKDTLSIDFRQSFVNFVGADFTCDGPTTILTPTTNDVAAYNTIRAILAEGEHAIKLQERGLRSVASQ